MPNIKRGATRDYKVGGVMLGNILQYFIHKEEIREEERCTTKQNGDTTTIKTVITTTTYNIPTEVKQEVLKQLINQR